MSSHQQSFHTNCIASFKWSHIVLLFLLLRFHMSEQQQRRQQGHELMENRHYEKMLEYHENGHPVISNDDSNDHYSGRKPGNSHSNGHRRGHRKKKHNRNMDDNHENGLALWISEPQLKMLSAMFFPQDNLQGRLYAIENGQVLDYIRDMSMFSYLNIPSEVNYVNFTWKAGRRKYLYHFDRLKTFDDTILKAPTVSIKPKGRIPQEEKSFSVFLPCNGNNNKSGIAMFSVGLSIKHRRGKPLPGTPLRMNFKKECAHRGPDPECEIKCIKNGFCNHNNICQCHAGYTGEYCQSAICFPNCLNGGNCTAPSVCTCPTGYQGTSCEGGICAEKCENGGKCIQKDKCQCSNGYYGLRCEFSKCVIPCKNGGRCIGTNICRCPSGLGGNHCEIGRKQRSTCKRPCKHGVCMRNKTCKCDPEFHGRFCNRKIKKHRKNNR